ncbi:hypothetical protein OH77DRAFT_230150 [Trametes cingulata]|nr:hypothetical protein OH77DRAFT_230150 [Trametes cingulata]
MVADSERSDFGETLEAGASQASRCGFVPNAATMGAGDCVKRELQRRLQYFYGLRNLCRSLPCCVPGRCTAGVAVRRRPTSSHSQCKSELCRTLRYTLTSLHCPPLLSRCTEPFRLCCLQISPCRSCRLWTSHPTRRARFSLQVAESTSRPPTVYCSRPRAGKRYHRFTTQDSHSARRLWASPWQPGDCQMSVASATYGSLSGAFAVRSPVMVFSVLKLQFAFLTCATFAERGLTQH